jgi:hypothetical protein
MAVMSRILLVDIAKQGLLIKCDKDIDPVNVRLNLPLGGSHAIVAVFTFDV